MSFWQIWLLFIIATIVISLLIQGMIILMVKLPEKGALVVMAVFILAVITIMATGAYYEQF